MNVGIVGLPNVGKTTIFNALTSAHAPSENYPFCTVEPNRGSAAVPDARLERLAEIVHPRKTIPSRIEFLDVPGLIEGASRGQGLGNQFLSHIREAKALAQVVRCFGGEDVAYVLPDLCPSSEIEIVGTELLLADFQLVERAAAKASRDDKTARLLMRMREALACGSPMRSISLSEDERCLLKEYGLLTLKPLIVVANIGERGSEAGRRWEEEAREAADRAGAPFLAICGAIEQELAGLAPGEAAEFLREMELPGGALPRFVKACYDLLGVITFFTVEHEILQAWAVPRGTAASSAAGRIHTDMEHGFVKAEVISFEDLDRAGEMAAARAGGLLRVEGRDYVVSDGDVIRFRFSQ